ncbi:hypothetical protein KQX54_013706 [Cotesia glomerata]|uniref:Ankyrin repeat protein n=1 Tax=Cotesia glomerata TaxID=32391 RepID=A0AAV7HZH4_COTGL|nr:hypothetical protein KQX54_013706 [Cotesia glomerata]
MLEILLKEGADVQARDEKDESPLHVAITKGNTEAVGLLIQHGAKNMAELSLKNCIDESIKFHNKSSNENETFVYDSRKCRYSMTFWKYDPDCENRIRYYRQQILAYYFGYGGRNNNFNEDEYVYVQYGGVLGTSNHFTVSEQMPLEYCLERFNNSVVAKGYENFKSLASFEGKQSDVEMPYTTQLLLIQCIFGADVQARDKKDETPLHVAITKENTEAVGLLIQYSADVHSVSLKWETGFTLLHQAIVNNKKDIVNILISGGADINSDARILPIYYAALNDC